jgi:hypothetical protein
MRTPAAQSAAQRAAEAEQPGAMQAAPRQQAAEVRAQVRPGLEDPGMLNPKSPL